MAEPNYEWRNLNAKQRTELLAWRKSEKRPWHSPPHRLDTDRTNFLLTAACYEHRPYIGHSSQRMDAFSVALLDLLETHSAQIFSWCVLPNHYHALVQAENIANLLKTIGQLHGRTSFRWNDEEQTRGRKVFYRCTERTMRSERHFWATLNYIHHNPVHHQYVKQWTDWPWSSARSYLEYTGRDEAVHIWREFPIQDYGKKWDDPTI